MSGALLGSLGGLVLVAVFVVTLLFARALSFLAGEPRWLVSLALATMLQICVPISICRVTENLVSATLIHGMIALAGVLALWRRPPIAAPPIIAPALRIGRVATGLALIAFSLVVWAALKNYFWDEFNAHDPLASVMARGVAPPEMPFFPGEPFRYHYGFDVLSAEVRAFTGLFAPDAIDVVTICCFAMLLFAGASIGAALGPRPTAALVMLLAPFGTGTLLYFLLPELGPLEVRIPFFPGTWTQLVPPPIISNFFQHPQGLAMPVSIGVLLLFDGTDRSDKTRMARTVLGSLLLGMLSLGQIVFFSVLGVGIGVSIVVWALKARKPRLMAIELAILAGALVVAYALGGFFERSGGAAPAHFIELGRSMFAEPIGQAIGHHLVAFGIPLIALPLTVSRMGARATSLRVALFVAASIGFIVPNVMVYSRSWDVVKFYSVGVFFSNILLADLLKPLFSAEGAGSRARLKRGAAIAIAVLTSFVGWVWIVRMSWLDGRYGVPKMHFTPPPRIANSVAQQLGPLVKPHDRVFSTNMDMGAGAGFLTPGFDVTSDAGTMIDRDRMMLLHAHYAEARKTLRAVDLDALGVGWLVLSTGDIQALEPEGKTALEDKNRFEHVFEVTLDHDVREVYRILRAGDGH